MDLSESTPAGPRSGTQPQAQPERVMSRFLMRDSSSSSSSGAGSRSGSSSSSSSSSSSNSTTTRNSVNSSRPGTGDMPSDVKNTVESVSELEDTLSRSGAQQHDIAQSASSVTEHGLLQESGEQTAVPSLPAAQSLQSATGAEIRRNVAEDQNVIPDSTTDTTDNRRRLQVTFGQSPTRPGLPTCTSASYARRYLQNPDGVVILYFTLSTLKYQHCPVQFCHCYVSFMLSV
jgi:hypothetical protein